MCYNICMMSLLLLGICQPLLLAQQLVSFSSRLRLRSPEYLSPTKPNQTKKHATTLRKKKHEEVINIYLPFQTHRNANFFFISTNIKRRKQSTYLFQNTKKKSFISVVFSKERKKRSIKYGIPKRLDQKSETLLHWISSQCLPEFWALYCFL